MMIESRELSYDIDYGWILTLRGSGIKKIVGRRIIWNQTNLNGSVEKGIRNIINNNIINPKTTSRKISNFVLDTLNGYTDTFDVQLLGENIADWLENVGQLYGIGWDVYIKNNKYVFSLKKGTDRTFNQNSVTPVIFSTITWSPTASGTSACANQDWPSTVTLPLLSTVIACVTSAVLPIIISALVGTVSL
jgi:hypothetical protein